MENKKTVLEFDAIEIAELLLCITCRNSFIAQLYACSVGGEEERTKLNTEMKVVSDLMVKIMNGAKKDL